MQNQYNDSTRRAAPLTLGIDTGSPVTSVALGHGGRLLAAREAGGGRSSARLLALIDELMAECEVERGELEQILAARGPGSFTGLRVGLATVLGLHQALGVAATAVGSLGLLAHSAADPGDPRPVVALVDALRGEWFAQAFAGGGRGPALEAAAIVGPEGLLDRAPCRLTGFGLERLPPALARADGVEVVPASALAPSLIDIAADAELQWDPAPLVAPLYLRPPAALAG